MSDPVTNPEHYDLGGGLEVLDVIEALGWGKDYLRANACKYLLRHERKGDPITDLRKARYCIDRLIEMLEEEGPDGEVYTYTGPDYRWTTWG